MTRATLIRDTLIRTNAVAFSKLLRAFLAGEILDYDDMVQITGLSRDTCARWLAPWRRNCRNTPHCIYIAKWLPDKRGQRCRVAAFAYSAEPKRDADKYPLSPAEVKRRYRARKKMKDQAAALHNALFAEVSK